MRAVEKALQLKGIEYRRVDIPPVAHKAVQKALFGRGTVPGLRLDGRKIIGSREIMRALDDAVPEPPLLPADEKAAQVGRARRGVGRRGAAADGAADHLGGAAALAGVDGVVRRRLLAPDPRRGHAADARRWSRARSRRSTTATELNVRADLRALDQHLARVERWMDHDVVGGAAPNAADLQIGSGLALHPHDRATWRTPSARAARPRRGSRICPRARRWFRGTTSGHVPARATR